MPCIVSACRWQFLSWSAFRSVVVSSFVTSVGLPIRFSNLAFKSFLAFCVRDNDFSELGELIDVSSMVESFCCDGMVLLIFGVDRSLYDLVYLGSSCSPKRIRHLQSLTALGLIVNVVES